MPLRCASLQDKPKDLCSRTSTSASEKIPFHIHGREQALHFGWSSQSSLLDTGLISDDRTGPLQLQQTEQDRLRRRLELKAKAQYGCPRAAIDVKLRRAMLRRFTGNDEDLHPGECCLYWRETGNRFHTIQWRGQQWLSPFRQTPTLAASTPTGWHMAQCLLRASRQHVRRLVSDDGVVNGSQSAEQAPAGLRQR